MNFQPQYMQNGAQQMLYIPRHDQFVDPQYFGPPVLGPPLPPPPVFQPYGPYVYDVGQNNVNIVVNQGYQRFPTYPGPGPQAPLQQAQSQPEQVPQQAPQQLPPQYPQQVIPGAWPIYYQYPQAVHRIPTATEVVQNHVRWSANDNPQDMVPADKDPSRFYSFRELDGSWTRRNRFTIDSGEIGKSRWYQRTDGTFFATRLPDA